MGVVGAVRTLVTLLGQDISTIKRDRSKYRKEAQIETWFDSGEINYHG